MINDHNVYSEYPYIYQTLPVIPVTVALLTLNAHFPGIPTFDVEDMLITASVLEPVTSAKFTISPALKPTVAGFPPSPAYW